MKTIVAYTNANLSVSGIVVNHGPVPKALRVGYWREANRTGNYPFMVVTGVAVSDQGRVRAAILEASEPIARHVLSAKHAIHFVA